MVLFLYSLTCLCLCWGSYAYHIKELEKIPESAKNAD